MENNLVGNPNDIFVAKQCLKNQNKVNLPYDFDDYDPAPFNNPENRDGLKEEWGNCVFVNPPYSNLKTTKKNGLGYIEKAHIEAQKGKTIVLLIPARTDTTWFHDIIVKHNYEVKFIKGRLKFNNDKNPAPFPSMLVIMKNI